LWQVFTRWQGRRGRPARVREGGPARVWGLTWAEAEALLNWLERTGRRCAGVAVRGGRFEVRFWPGRGRG
jgi:hypothetical protein